MKKCSICGEEKSLENFHFKAGKKARKTYCKICDNTRNRELLSRRREEVRERDRIYVSKNKEKYREHGKKWYYKNQEKVKLKRKEYNSNPENMQKRNEYLRLRLKNDPYYKLVKNLRIRVYQTIKKEHKSAKTLDLLGCSKEEFKDHIEKQFLPGMTWDNYMRSGENAWHVDHIRPCASFDLTDPAQQRECFNYTNLQPLWAKENISKHAKWPYYK